ncbi:MAG: aminotransferase class IV [Beutenbergiaceae bacterium]
MSELVYVDGAFHEPHTPVVTALDHGLTVGDGVFETCQMRSDGVFALTRHLQRLARSAAGLGLAVPDEQSLRQAVTAVHQRWVAQGGGRGRLRITWTAGHGPLGPTRAAGAERLLVSAGPVGAAGPLRVTVAPWIRNERSPLVGLKTTSYAENVVIANYAKGRGATEAILGNSAGQLCEGTASNVFVEHDGSLVTPPLASGCLAGVTRELVLEWGQQAGLPVAERALPLSVLQGVAHAALTASTRGIAAITSIDERPLQPGPLTQALSREYQRRSAAELDP